MSLLADLLSTVFDRRYGATAQAAGSRRPLGDQIRDLLGTAGEVSGLTLARDILAGYAGLDDAGKLGFLRDLALGMNIDPEVVRSALDGYEKAPSKASYRSFLEAAEPRRQEVIRRLNRVPGATGRLVAMRADLLRLGRGDADLEALDLDFRHLFGSWFNHGFLVLRPISWESPALILEKIITYEAVHAIDSWEDLRRRLQPGDRRCFAFFHPAMPDEPLIFVEVALTRGIAASIQSLLAEDRAVLPQDQADTAVFYSISNCQAGLAGISFGNSLIKQVAADLAAELPGVKTFVTLSPIPALASWAAEAGLAAPQTSSAARGLAAHYLLQAKDKAGRPFDPVARFHLGNGAQVQAVQAEADVSPKGRAQSFGVMVNYLYDLPRVSQNHESYATKSEVVASAGVAALAKAGAPVQNSER